MIHTDLLLPLERQSPAVTGEEFNRFLELFAKMSFRKLVRRLTNARGEPVSVSVLEGMAGARATEYADFLVALGIAIHDGDHSIRLTRQVDNIGPTLEWYVAELCKGELAGDAQWAVQLEELPVGGDFDVLGWLAPTLLYVELKSAAPSQVSESELRNFLQRDQELAPDMSVLLIDTDDEPGLTALVERLNDVVMPLVGAPKSRPTFRPVPSHPGLIYGWRRIYIAGSQPSILTQLRRALQHYHASVKGVAVLGGPIVNFVSGEVIPDD